MPDVTVTNNRIPEVLARVEKAARAAVEEEVEELTADVKRFAPVDTGKLEGAIEGEMTGSLAGQVVSGENVPYDIMQEYGTRYQRGTPHFRPAAEISRRRFPDRLKDAIKDALRG